MWQRPRGTLVHLLSALLLTACGCTISITPWTKGPPPPHPPGVDPGLPPGVVPSTFPANLFQGPAPRPLTPAQQNVGGPVVANNETLVLMNKTIADLEESRRAMAEQIVSLNKQLAQRNEAIKSAAHEMEESRGSLARARDEARKIEAEVAELRTRIQKLENYRKTVSRDLEEILALLERPREMSRSPYLDRLPK